MKTTKAYRCMKCEGLDVPMHGVECFTHKPQHTPTPWSVDREAGTDCGVMLEAHRTYIGEISSDAGLEEAEVNAAYIVRAVNSHEELLEIAKVLCDMAKKGMEPSAERLEDYRRVISKAESGHE